MNGAIIKRVMKNSVDSFGKFFSSKSGLRKKSKVIQSSERTLPLLMLKPYHPRSTKDLNLDTMVPRIAVSQSQQQVIEQVLPKLKVVMDVDECMLFAYEVPARELSRQKSSSNESFIVWTDGSNSYPLKVFLRPGLKVFLHEVSKFADIYVMTAGNLTYANPLIRAIDPEGNIFKEVITREKFDFRGGKDLEVLGENYDMKRTVLVDNMARNFSYQRSNGILVREYLGDPRDDQLDYVLDLLLSLHQAEDVRKFLEPICENGEYFHAFADEFSVWE